MDMKNLFVGMIVAGLIIIVGSLAIIDLGTSYGTNNAEMNEQLQPLNTSAINMQGSLKNTSDNMQAVFTGTNASGISAVTSELEALYKSASSIVRLVINSINLPVALLHVVSDRFSLLSFLITFALVAFVGVVIISVAYVLLKVN